MDDGLLLLLSLEDIPRGVKVHQILPMSNGSMLELSVYGVCGIYVTYENLGRSHRFTLKHGSDVKSSAAKRISHAYSYFRSHVVESLIRSMEESRFLGERLPKSFRSLGPWTTLSVGSEYRSIQDGKFTIRLEVSGTSAGRPGIVLRFSMDASFRTYPSTGYAVEVFERLAVEKFGRDRSIRSMIHRNRRSVLVPDGWTMYYGLLVKTESMRIRACLRRASEELQSEMTLPMFPKDLQDS